MTLFILSVIAWIIAFGFGRKCMIDLNKSKRTSTESHKNYMP